MKHRERFHLSFVSGDGDQVATDPDLIIGKVKARRYWDTAVLEPSEGQFPRLHLEFHGGYGFVVQCFEDEASWGWFLQWVRIDGFPRATIWEGRQGRETWERDHPSAPKIR